MARYISIGFIIVLAATVYFGGFFIKKEKAFDENLRLKQENEELRAQIYKLQTTDYGLKTKDCGLRTADKNYLSVKVFSEYPFNIKNKITVNAGEKQGIGKSASAVLKDNILVGEVVEVFKNYSVVKTIFDPTWQVSVRIGKEETNGLFQGGAEPKVVLIDKEKPLQVGDVVYSASVGFPYGLKIGEVKEIRENSAGVFKEALLKMPFNPAELREINLIVE